MNVGGATVTTVQAYQRPRLARPGSPHLAAAASAILPASAMPAGSLRRGKIKRNTRSTRVIGVTVATCCAALVSVALASAAAPVAHTATAPACTAANTQIWLGDGEGGGTAGKTYYPLEFSNVGHKACTLYGYPGVSAVSDTGHQVGLPATHDPSTVATITIKAGGTAHDHIAIVDWGAVCATGAAASGLKIYAPGQTQAKQIEFAFTTCAAKSTLIAGPIDAGVGVPGYTFP